MHRTINNGPLLSRQVRFCIRRVVGRAGRDSNLRKGLFREAFFVSEGKYPRDLWKSPYLWGIIKNA